MNSNDVLTLENGDARLQLMPRSGGTITGLALSGIEVLTEGPEHGCFPMAPWCGRIRDGQLAIGAQTHQFPLNADPHSMHGTSRDGTWEVVDASGTHAVLTHDLTSPWPAKGQVTQTVALFKDHLDLMLEVSSSVEHFPAQAGWHPWFNRYLREDADPVLIDFRPDWQELRGPDFLPTGERIAPREGPWDDCFGMPDGVSVALTWPEMLRLEVQSREAWVVVYDVEEHAVCVEPQSGPPNGVNTMPRLVTPETPLTVRSRWAWTRL